MSENEKPQVRTDEPELTDDALEQVAGGCQWGESGTGNTLNTLNTMTDGGGMMTITPIVTVA
ncbi:MAG TPA: hypothetical protein VF665_03020 [Longimicrobium sp.]|jgi:hypothetical protein|uniref:hypothetical protein n=1 Tax=Longimicrobium sp. TaxID=2029185 RepID=UPI002EDB25AF